MPVGYLITLFLLGTCVLLLLAPVRKRPLGLVSFWGGLLVNEQAHWFAVLLCRFDRAGLRRGRHFRCRPGDRGLAVLAEAGLIVLFLQGRFGPAGPCGKRWPLSIQIHPPHLPGRRSYLAALAAPAGDGPKSGSAETDIPYGPVPGRANRLDLYLPRHGSDRPDHDLYARGQVPVG